MTKRSIFPTLCSMCSSCGWRLFFFFFFFRYAWYMCYRCCINCINVKIKIILLIIIAYTWYICLFYPYIIRPSPYINRPLTCLLSLPGSSTLEKTPFDLSPDKVPSSITSPEDTLQAILTPDSQTAPIVAPPPAYPADPLSPRVFPSSQSPGEAFQQAQQLLKSAGAGTNEVLVVVLKGHRFCHRKKMLVVCDLSKRGDLSEICITSPPPHTPLRHFFTAAVIIQWTADLVSDYNAQMTDIYMCKWLPNVYI